jgi:hypothetical protein
MLKSIKYIYVCVCMCARARVYIYLKINVIANGYILQINVFLFTLLAIFTSFDISNILKF